MKNMPFFLFFLILFLKRFCLGGYVYLADSAIEYQNAQNAQNFSFIFSLESGLSSSDYIYVKFPFSLGKFASIEDRPKATISTSLTQTLYINETFYSAFGDADQNYFFNFPINLQKNTWYRIKIIASQASIFLQKEGFQGLVEIYTVSSLSENRIYYDKNTIFEKIQLGPPPANNMLGSCTIDQNNITKLNNPEAMLTTYFDINLFEGNDYGGTIELIMNDNSFVFTSNCYLIECIANIDYPSCENNITYDSIDARCETATNKINLIFDSGYSSNTTIRIKTLIQNPTRITQSTATSFIIVRQTSRQSSFIINAVNVSCNLKVNQIQMNTNIIQLFWGLQPTGLTNNAGCPISLYKIPLNPKIIPWNSIRLIFSLKKTTPAIPLMLKIDLTPSFEDFLIGSVSSTVPLHSSTTKVKCQVSNSQYLYCGSFASLIALTSYSISFKMTIKNGINDNLLIGGIQFIDIVNNVEYTNLLYPSTPIPSIENAEYLDLASAGVNSPNANGGYPNMNYNQMISYYESDTLTYNIGKSDYGLGVGDIISASYSGASAIQFPSSGVVAQKIITFLQVSSQQMCQNTATRCYTSVTDGDHTMLKMVFNNRILNIPSTDFTKGVELIDSIFANVDSSASIIKCSSGGWCSQYNTYSSQTTKINQIYEYTPSSSSYNSYHHVTVICQTPAGAGLKQCHQIVGRAFTYGSGGDKGGFSAFALRNAQINSYPSFFADLSSFDFILCFKYQGYSVSGTNNVASTDESQWTLSTSGIIPSYIVTEGFYKSDLKVSWINYYGKTGDGLTSDTYLPFILRVGGKFSTNSDSPIFSSDTVALFLGSNIDITAYKEGSILESSDDTINCGQPGLSMFTCKVYPRLGSTFTQKDVWTNQPRIEFEYTFENDQYFNFYIPIKPSIVSGVISSLDSLNLVIMNKISENYVINAVYRLIGSVLGGVYSFNPMSEANSVFGVAGGFWSGLGASDNCQNLGYPTLDSSVTLKPNSYYSSSFKINSQIEGNKNAYCINSKPGSDKNGWGTAFTMASDIDIFSSISSITWDFAGEVNGVDTNVCTLLNYRLPLLNKRVYAIICPVDSYSGLSNPTIGGSYKYLLLENMTWPWWWGDSNMPSNLIRYGWSRSDGSLVAYKSESSRVYSSTSCLSSDLILLQGVSYMKYEMFIIPDITISLTNTTNFDNFFIRMKLNSSTTENLVFEKCEFILSDYEFSCSLIIFSLYVDFYINYAGEGTINLDNIMTLNIYLSANSKQFSDDYYLQIYSPNGFYIENFLIDTCTSAKIETNRTGLIPSVFMNISNLTFIPSFGALSFFFLTFDTLSRNIYKGTEIVISLGSLSVPINPFYEMECQIFQGNNFSLISFEWDSIELVSGSDLFITPKNDIIEKYVFTVECYGALVQSDAINLTPVTAQMKKNGSLDAMQISNPLPLENISQSYSFPILTLTKSFSYLGMEANYFFEFTFYRGEISTDGRIYIVFPKRFPSYLNSYEQVKCFLDNYLVFCEMIEENLLSISCHKNLSYLSIEAHTVEVYGIAQPNMTDYTSHINNQIIFMMDDDSILTNGVLVYGEVKDNFNYITNHVYKGIGILDFINSNDYTRDSTDFFLKVKFDSGSIIENSTIYLKLENSFYTALLENYNLRCFLYSEQDLNKVFNYIQENCTLVNITNIKMIIISNDSNNTKPQTYNLIIQKIPTPYYFSQYTHSFFEIFYIRTFSGINTVYQTAVGFFNATYPIFTESNSINLKWFKYDYSNGTYSENYDYYLDIFLGRYSTLISLSLDEGVFNLTYNYSLTGNDSSNFLISPSYNPSIIKGSKINSFYIASTFNATPGVYFLTFQKEANGDNKNWTSPIPPLLVNLNAAKCQIKVDHDVYEIPIGKTSFPIYLDFHLCIPVTELFVLANIKVGYQEYHLSLIDGTKLSQSLIKKVSVNMEEYPQIFFKIINQDIFQNLTVGLTGILSFSLFGENSNSFLPPKDIQLKLIDSISFRTPPIPSIPKVTLFENTAGITVKCSQPSEIFYSLKTKEFNSSFNYNDIKTKTIDLNIYQTNRNSEDPDWTIYGYRLQNEYSALYLNVSDLKSNGNYYFCYFCLNRFSIISPIGPTISWIQNDNGGRISKFYFTFNSSISTLLNNYLICSMTEILSVENSQVLDVNGTTCSLERRLLATTTTTTTDNSLNLTNATNISISNSNVSINTDVKYLYFVMPDLEIPFEDIQELIQERMDTIGALNFAQYIINNTQVRESFPPLKNFTYYIYQDVYSYAPTANITGLNTTDTSLSFNITLNQTGFIMLAVDSNSSNKPNLTEFKQGLDKNGNSLKAWDLLNLNKNETFLKEFSNLTQNTQYFLWYALWNDDPSIDGVYSSIYQIKATTNKTLNQAATNADRKIWIGLCFLIGFILII